MAQTIVFEITVRGEERELIKEIFETHSKPETFGAVWEIPGHKAMLCDAKAGDGIRVESDHILIKGECRGYPPPLALVEELSEQFQALHFEAGWMDLGMQFSSQWWFHAGECGLIDCRRFSWEGEDQNYKFIYVEDGVQKAPLPDWVPANSPVGLYVEEGDRKR